MPRVLVKMDSGNTVPSLAKQCGLGFTLLRPSVESFEDGLHKDAVEDASGRFNVWVANQGALHPPESMGSIEARLRDAPLMRSSIISGLERLVSSQGRSTVVLFPVPEAPAASKLTGETQYSQGHLRRENAKQNVSGVYG